jgi:hypothetical protein
MSTMRVIRISLEKWLGRELIPLNPIYPVDCEPYNAVITTCLGGARLRTTSVLQTLASSQAETDSLHSRCLNWTCPHVELGQTAHDHASVRHQ